MKEIKLTKKGGPIKVLEGANLSNLLTDRDPKQLQEDSKDLKLEINKTITDSKPLVEGTVRIKISLEGVLLQPHNMVEEGMYHSPHNRQLKI